MKEMSWIAVLVLCVGWILPAGYAQEQTDLSEVRSMLARQVANRAEALALMQQRFEVGQVTAEAVMNAEEQLLTAQLALARERETAEKGPLERPIPRIEFPPMSLGDVSETLRELLEGRVNFVLKDEAAALGVPALNLRGTDLLTLLNILSDIVPGLGIKVTVGSQVVGIDQVPARMGMAPAAMMGMGPFGGEMGFGGREPSPVALAENATVIFERMQSEPSAPRHTLTLYLGDLLDEMALDDICTSIETAWDLNPGTLEPILRFHEDTDLLIVAGDKNHMEAAQDVITQLGRRREALRSQTKQDLQERYKAVEEEMKARLEQRRVDLDEEFQAAREQYEEQALKWEKRVQSGVAELDELREELAYTKKIRAEERHRLQEKMEQELFAAREIAFQERGDLLEKIDTLERALSSPQR